MLNRDDQLYCLLLVIGLMFCLIFIILWNMSLISMIACFCVLFVGICIISLYFMYYFWKYPHVNYYGVSILRSGPRVSGLEEKCAICLTHNQEEGICLPCQHCFHVTCLSEWFKRKIWCPLCNQAI